MYNKLLGRCTALFTRRTLYGTINKRVCRMIVRLGFCFAGATTARLTLG